MKPQYSFLLTIWLCFFSAISSVSVAAEDVDQLLDLSGISKQVTQLPGVVKAGFLQGAQKDKKISEDEISAVLDSVDKDILPSVIIGEIRSSIKENLTGDDIKALLSWYQSQPGMKITQAEEEGSTPAAYEQIIVSAPKMLANTKRVEVAKRLDKLTSSTDVAMDIQKFTSIATYSALMTALAPEKEINIEGYKAQLAAVEPQMRSNTETLVIVSFVYAYQSIDDASLIKYEEFLKTPAARKFIATGSKAMNKGLETVVKKWATDMATILKNQKKMNADKAV